MAILSLFLRKVTVLFLLIEMFFSGLYGMHHQPILRHSLYNRKGLVKEAKLQVILTILISGKFFPKDKGFISNSKYLLSLLEELDNASCLEGRTFFCYRSSFNGLEDLNSTIYSGLIFAMQELSICEYSIDTKILPYNKQRRFDLYYDFMEKIDNSDFACLCDLLNYNKDILRSFCRLLKGRLIVCRPNIENRDLSRILSLLSEDLFRLDFDYVYNYYCADSSTMIF